MPLLSAIAFFILLSLLASTPSAQAAEPPLQRATALLSGRHFLYGGHCPQLCVEWFDGCNNCTCNRAGRIDVCTEHRCLWRGRPRCLRWGF